MKTNFNMMRTDANGKDKDWQWPIVVTNLVKAGSQWRKDGSQFNFGISRFVILFSIIVLNILMTQSALGQMKIKVGPTVGVNFAALNVKEDDSDEESEQSDIKAGLRGGAVVDFGITKYFSIVPEVLFSQRGWKYIGKDENKGHTQTGTINYLEVPVNLVFKIKLASETKLTLFPGFYTSYAISGKTKEVVKGGSKSTEKITIGKGEDDLNPLDLGLNLGIGMEIKSIFFRFQLHAGLKNLSNDKNSTSSNSAVSLSLGYLF